MIYCRSVCAVARGHVDRAISCFMLYYVLPTSEDTNLDGLHWQMVHIGSCYALAGGDATCICRYAVRRRTCMARQKGASIADWFSCLLVCGKDGVILRCSETRAVFPSCNTYAYNLKT